MAKLAPKFDFPDYDTSLGWKEAFKAQEEALDKLAEASAKIDFANPKASLKGALLKWQRADGYAQYIVTADRPLTIAHIPFGDAWTIEPALIRGLTRADIVEQLRRDKAMHDLFNSDKNKKQG